MFINQNDYKKNVKFITTENIYKVIILMSLPLIINGLVIKFFDSTNVYYASNIGSVELISVSFVGPMINLIVSIPVALTLALTAILAPLYAQKDEEKISKYISTLFVVTAAFMFILLSFSFIFAEQILLFQNATPEILSTSVTYLRFNLVATFFDYLIAFYFGVTTAKGDMNVTLRYNLILNAVRCALGLLFVNVLGFGIIGLSMSILLPKLAIGCYSLMKIFQEKFAINRVVLRRTLIVGFLVVLFPIIINKFSHELGMVIINAMVIEFSETVVAAYSITNSINSIFFEPTAGLATAIVTILAYNKEVGNLRRCREIVRKSIYLLLAYSTIVSIILVCGAPIIAKIFTAGDPDIYQSTIHAMRTYSWAVFGFGILQLYYSVYYAHKKAHISMGLAMAQLFVFRIPILYLFMNYTQLGEYSLWLMMLITNFILFPIIALIQRNPEMSFKVIKNEKGEITHRIEDEYEQA